jgi:DNA helicase HerA-like ATPase
MADRTRKALIVGQSGCGKTTLIKLLSARFDRVLHWDPEGEYHGDFVRSYRELALLLRRRAFTGVYRPIFAERYEDLPREFAGLASLLLECGKNLLVTVDEALEVVPRTGNDSGGLGRLLFKGRKRGISIFYATQYLSQLSRIIGGTTTLYLFKLNGRGDQQVLRSYLSEEEVQRVAALPPYEYVIAKK